MNTITKKPDRSATVSFSNPLAYKYLAQMTGSSATSPISSYSSGFFGRGAEASSKEQTMNSNIHEEFMYEQDIFSESHVNINGQTEQK